METKVYELKLTHFEAWAVLRALAVANASERQLEKDKAPCDWVAARILDLQEIKHG